MVKQRKIAEYRERLDKTLASPELINRETLKTLVKNQLLNSSADEVGVCTENVVEKKTTEVSNLLDMMRSASVKDNEVSTTSEGSHGEWKLKHDTEEFRVMYREGPHGTPFHSLLVEGYVEAPLDVCLCVSWESTLYKKWWPQYTFPPFKIITSNCLQRVRIGEQISLVRVKVPWPLSAREAVVHYFLFEYFQDGLAIVLINTISDVKSIDKSTHGFTNDAIPEAKEVVRIDLVGGFALQKVTEERSYFRTIANMDIKLDFVPPSLMNFVARQLVGSGFKLYQKAVTSISASHDEDYSKALEEPLYTQTREALYSSKEPKEALNAKRLKNDVCTLPEEHFIEGRWEGINEMEQKVHSINDDCKLLQNDVQVTDRNIVGEIEDEVSQESKHMDEDKDQHSTDEILKKHVTESLQNDAQVTGRNVVSEIEEEEIEQGPQSDEDEDDIYQSSTDEIPEKGPANDKINVISPRVEQALQTLEKAIYMVREYGFNIQSKSLPVLTNEKPTNTETVVIKDSISSDDGVHAEVELPEKENMDKNLQESRNSAGIQDSGRSASSSYLREGNHNKIAPASSKDLSNSGDSKQGAFGSSRNGTVEIPNFKQTMCHSKQKNACANGIHENTINGGKKLSRQKKQGFCCFSFSYA